MARRSLITTGILTGLLALALAASGSVAAQSPKHEPPSARSKKMPAPPAKLPRVKPSQAKNLDFLFGALKAAPDQESAKEVEGRIWAVWMSTSSDTTALLMARARLAMEHKEYDVAMKLLDAIIKLQPDYVEAWNKRATLYYLRDDYVHSMEDIQQVLKREPRHFGALAGLGLILQETGDDKHALDAYRRALAIHPHLEKIPDLVKSLSEKIEGRDI